MDDGSRAGLFHFHESGWVNVFDLLIQFFESRFDVGRPVGGEKVITITGIGSGIHDDTPFVLGAACRQQAKPKQGKRLHEARVASFMKLGNTARRRKGHL